MDVNVNVNYKASEINGLFNEIESMKNQRKALSEQIEYKTDQIISHIEKHGPVLAYKNDMPHVLTVSGRYSTKFNKAQLAEDTGVDVTDLDLIGVAELVEKQKTSSEMMKSYQSDEMKRVLKARKAKKSDVDLLGSRAF